MAAGACVLVRLASWDGICRSPEGTRSTSIRVFNRAADFQSGSGRRAIDGDWNRVPLRGLVPAPQLVSPPDRGAGVNGNRGDWRVLDNYASVGNLKGTDLTNS